jgi:phenylalanyl-tRNA synthetase beta subunit
MSLVSKNNCFNITDDKLITIKNPKSIECKVLRSYLFPSLKCIQANQHHQVPLKIFEIADVGILADNNIGSSNERKLCMAIVGKNSFLEDLQEAFDFVMKRFGINII